LECAGVVEFSQEGGRTAVRNSDDIDISQSICGYAGPFVVIGAADLSSPETCSSGVVPANEPIAAASIRAVQVAAGIARDVNVAEAVG
jgi:hypothetical protein